MCICNTGLLGLIGISAPFVNLSAIILLSFVEILYFTQPLFEITASEIKTMMFYEQYVCYSGFSFGDDFVTSLGSPIEETETYSKLY